MVGGKIVLASRRTRTGMPKAVHDEGGSGTNGLRSFCCVLVASFNGRSPPVSASRMRVNDWHQRFLIRRLAQDGAAMANPGRAKNAFVQLTIAPCCVIGTDMRGLSLGAVNRCLALVLPFAALGFLPIKTAENSERTADPPQKAIVLRCDRNAVSGLGADPAQRAAGRGHIRTRTHGYIRHQQWLAFLINRKVLAYLAIHLITRRGADGGARLAGGLKRSLRGATLPASDARC
jgi:hypothetical protein